MGNNVYGIDLGTYNLKVFCKATGKVINEKNTVAIVNKNQLYAFGNDAYAMYEKAPESIQVSFPVVNGVIADYNNMQTMIVELMDKYSRNHNKGAEFVVAVPTDITEVEKKAFFDLFYKSRFKPKSVLLCEKPIADAVGLDLDVNSPTGYMIVNIGADTTEISVISLGGLVLSELLHFGGKRLDECIMSHLRRQYSLVIGEKTACFLKEELGCALPDVEDKTATIVGRDVVSGLPVEMEITTAIVYEAIKESLASISTSIKMILERTPPELARDIIHSGIYLTGGASQISCLDQLFTQITNIRVNLCEYPEESAVRGLNKIVSEEQFKKLAFSMKTIIFR